MINGPDPCELLARHPEEQSSAGVMCRDVQSVLRRGRLARSDPSTAWKAPPPLLCLLGLFVSFGFRLVVGVAGEWTASGGLP